MNDLVLLFLSVALTDFFAEMGDKTQLMLIGLTSKYKIRDIILGTLVAVLVLNGIAVLAGGLLNELIPGWLIKFIAAGAFLYFSVSTLFNDDEDEEESKSNALKFAPVAVFCTFFVAELGDKTQLTAITFGANNGLKYALIVWLACSVGLFAADIVGMLVGLFLKKKAPDWVLKAVAYILFCIFGFITLHEGLVLFSIEKAVDVPVVPVLVAAGVVFVAVSGVIILFRKRYKG